MQNACFSLVAPVLGFFSKRHSLRQLLHCQHWRHGTTTLQAAGKQRGNKAFQRLCRPSKRLGRYWGSAPVSRAPICPRNHPLQCKLISCHHNDFFVEHFGIDKIRKLVGQKYYWPSLREDIESYVGGYNICLTLKAVRHKPYGDLKSLLIPTYWWKNLYMNFVTSLLLSADGKGDSYNSILIIVDQLTKIVH